MALVGLFALPIWAWCALAGAVFLALGLAASAVATIAPKLPLFHRLPLVGAPAVTIRIRPVEAEDGSWSSHLWEIGVSSTSRLEDGSLTVLAPEDVDFHHSSFDGRQRLDDGAFLALTDEPVDPACHLSKPWVKHVDVRGATVGYFTFYPGDINRPRFRIRVKVGSDKLFRPASEDFEIEANPFASLSRRREKPKPLDEQLADGIRKGQLLAEVISDIEKRSDDAWDSTIFQVGRWMRDMGAVLYDFGPEFIGDFSLEWRPSGLESRDAIAAGIKNRMAELSEILKEVRRRQAADAP